ncbi:hypothetical protein [Streptomyces sp. NPDC002788]
MAPCDQDRVAACADACVVIDREGVVRWACVDTDRTRRAEPADILAALDAPG